MHAVKFFVLKMSGMYNLLDMVFLPCCMKISNLSFFDSYRDTHACYLYLDSQDILAIMNWNVMYMKFIEVFLIIGEPGSSVSIVSGYGLDDRTIEVRSPQRRKDFSCTCVQTGSGSHPASCTMGTGCPIPGAKARPGRDT
jgi:hypothetical protein